MKLTTVMIACLWLAACSGELNNDLPESEENKAINARMEDLEKDVSVVAANDRQREQGLELTKKTVGETNAYLSELYENINDTRPEDLPEWEDMYRALTDEAAFNDPDYGLGPRELPTNFYKLHQIANDQAVAIKKTQDDLSKQDAKNAQQDKTLALILERLTTIDNNIADLNKTVEAKFKEVDKTLRDYDGRIDGVENRMKTIEVDLDTFRQEFVSYRQRVTNIEDLLRRYDLATMHNDISNLKDAVANHDERLIDLQGRVQINASEINNNRNDLLDTEQELSGVSSEVGTLKAAVNEIFTKLEECGCMKTSAVY